MGSYVIKSKFDLWACKFYVHSGGCWEYGWVLGVQIWNFRKYSWICREQLWFSIDGGESYSAVEKMVIKFSDVFDTRDVATAGGGGRQSPALRFRAHH